MVRPIDRTGLSALGHHCSLTRKSGMTKLYIDNGRVNCPKRGDLDIDNCAGCPDFRDIRKELEGEILVCSRRYAPQVSWFLPG